MAHFDPPGLPFAPYRSNQWLVRGAASWLCGSACLLGTACGDSSKSGPEPEEQAGSPLQPVACESQPLVEVAITPTPNWDNWDLVGDRMYTVTRNRQNEAFRIFDLTDPSAPVELGSIDLRSGGDVLHHSDYVYVAAGSSDLLIVDVGDPTTPTIAATFELPEGTPFNLLRQDDSSIWVGSLSALWLLDLTDPLLPTVRSSLELDDLFSKPTLVGNRLYAMSDPIRRDTPATLHVIDVSDASQPSIVRSTELPNLGSNYRSLLIREEFGYIALSQGIATLDLTDPEAPGDLQPTEGDRVSYLVADGNHLYATGEDGMRVFDLSDPASPRQIGHYDGRTYSEALVQGERAYVLDAEVGMVTVDLNVQCPSASNTMQP